jgi:hypothetical protein
VTWLLKLFPDQWMIYAAVLAASFAAGGTAAWQFQSMRYAAKENARAQQELADVELAAKTAFKRQDAVITATNSARARETRLRSDADGARASAGGLRDELAAAMQAAGANFQACTALAVTQSELFLGCTERYTSVAREADAWASDAETLNDGWPQ